MNTRKHPDYYWDEETDLWVKRPKKRTRRELFPEFGTHASMSKHATRDHEYVSGIPLRLGTSNSNSLHSAQVKSRMSRWSSSSFYKKTAPSAQTWSVNNGEGRIGIHVSGRDFVSDVDAHVPADPLVYKVDPFAILVKPTDTKLFQWMGNLARQFGTYKFTKLKFVYEPHTSSVTNGVIGLYFDPDPTNASIVNDWSDLTKRGVNVHGSVWAKHILDVPLSLCASRKEYYLKETFDKVKVDHFAYDMLEYFPGFFGFMCEKLGDGTRAGDHISLGKVYVEYSIVLGKAEPAMDPITNAVNQQVAASYIENSGPVNLAVFRPVVAKAVAIANSQVFFGKDQADTPVNQRAAGHAIFSQNPNDHEATAVNDLHLLLNVTLASASGNWAADPVLYGVKSAGAADYTWHASSIAGKVSRRFDAGSGTTSYMSLVALNLKKGDKFACKLAAAPGGTWASSTPGYHLRFSAMAFDADVTPSA